jgi:hypothetical protein
MRTWVPEAVIVASVLGIVAALTGGGLLQWVSALAVLLSFMHAQVADRMTEKQQDLARRGWAGGEYVECWRWSRRYFMGKELAWCAVFTMGRAWPALAGVGLFLAYPVWREVWRHRQRTGAWRYIPLFLAVSLCLSLHVDALADAPAPKPRRPRAAQPSPSPTPVPFDLVPTDPPESLPEEPAPAPSPSPTPAPPPSSLDKANGRPFRVLTAVGALGTVTADGGTDVTPTVWVDTEGPIALGNDHAYGRLGARIALSSSPGETVNAADVATYRSASVGLRAGYVIGHFRDVETMALAEGSFSSRLKGSTNPPPLNRLVRAGGIGLRFDHRKSNAYLAALVGFDEASASCDAQVVCTGLHSGWALMAYGQVPIVSGAVLFTGDVTLSVGGSATYFRRRDIMRIGAVLDPVQAIRVLKGSK